ncbi:glycosyltransferase [Halosimplex litoreum]|uniref:Glycosyltransferase n=1 Tax=Halosimplex litoreum TaxID=1198301 RepID=A0A7U3WBJ8_9EURY|nr:glycosyltransferase [Halosimplex litoreum]QPV64993.1 glycosyltransferase [Halosimplex litoreum]
MTVWFLIGRLDVGGAERTLLDLVSGLGERFDPTIWTIESGGPLADEVPSDVSVRSLDAGSKFDAPAVAKFVRTLRRERPALLQSFLFFDNTLARLAGLTSRETVVITGVRAVPNDRPRHRMLVDRLTMPLSDAVVSNSAAGAEWVVDQGASAARVSVIRNGRDTSRYDQMAPDSYRERLGIPPGPIVGTIGRLIERKGHHDLLDAWPTIRATHDDAQLVVVGDGPEREALHRHAQRVGCRDSVHFLGRRDDVPLLLDLFDVFAFPSHFEGLPGALLEAMCAGLPIVTTPVDGCSELVLDGEHGTHVPVSAPDALANAIVEYLSGPDIARTHGRAAKRRANADFSLEAMVDAFESLYDELLAEERT